MQKRKSGDRGREVSAYIICMYMALRKMQQRIFTILLSEPIF
jgi:hypothetical protein